MLEPRLQLLVTVPFAVRLTFDGQLTFKPELGLTTRVSATAPAKLLKLRSTFDDEWPGAPTFRLRPDWVIVKSETVKVTSAVCERGELVPLRTTWYLPFELALHVRVTVRAAPRETVGGVTRQDNPAGKLVEIEMVPLNPLSGETVMLALPPLTATNDGKLVLGVRLKS